MSADADRQWGDHCSRAPVASVRARSGGLRPHVHFNSTRRPSDNRLPESSKRTRRHEEGGEWAGDQAVETTAATAPSPPSRAPESAEADLALWLPCLESPGAPPGDERGRKPAGG